MGAEGTAGTGHMTSPSASADQFQQLLNGSERALQEAFPGAFGELYTQHAQAFRDLYAELRLYYRGANLHLEETLAEFWARLLERLFRQLHPQLLLPDDYLDCLGKQAEALRPFGDAPRELRLRATRAFVAARAFVQGLGVAGDVVRRVAQVRACGCRDSQGAHSLSRLPPVVCRAGRRRAGHWPDCWGSAGAARPACASPTGLHTHTKPLGEGQVGRASARVLTKSGALPPLAFFICLAVVMRCVHASLGGWSVMAGCWAPMPLEAWWPATRWAHCLSPRCPWAPSAPAPS